MNVHYCPTLSLKNHLVKGTEIMARRSQQEENKEKILDAILELGTKHGFQSIPMASLAKRSGLSPGTFYLYFKNKEDMIHWVFEAVKKRSEIAVLKDYDKTFTLRQQFKILFYNIIKYYIDHPAEFGFIEKYSSENYGSDLSVFSKDVENAFARIYKEGRKENLLRKLPFFALTSLVHGPIVALVRHHICGHLKCTNSLIKVMEEACWSSVIS